MVGHASASSSSSSGGHSCVAAKPEAKHQTSAKPKAKPKAQPQLLHAKVKDIVVDHGSPLGFGGTLRLDKHGSTWVLTNILTRERLTLADAHFYELVEDGPQAMLIRQQDDEGEADYIDIEGFKLVVYENSEGKRFIQHVDKPNNFSCLDSKQCSFKQCTVALRMAGATVTYNAAVYVFGQARGMGMFAFWGAQQLYKFLGLKTWRACPTV